MIEGVLDFPGHQLLWQTLPKRNHLSQALLLFGMQGLGKRLFASQLSQSFLCLRPKPAMGCDIACGMCKACLLFTSNNHPDFYHIKPECNKKIPISVIHDLIKFNSLASHYPQGKIAVIEEADRMNHYAYSALLKTLEEPNIGGVIILTTSRPADIQKTVSSRCSKLFFPKPKTSDSLSWLITKGITDNKMASLLLSLASQAPLLALQFHQNDMMKLRSQLFANWCGFSNKKLSLLQLSDKWKSLDLGVILWHMASWCRDAVVLKLIPENKQRLHNPDFATNLCQIVANVDKLLLVNYFDQLTHARRLFLLHPSLNTRLLIEQLLIHWSLLFQ